MGAIVEWTGKQLDLIRRTVAKDCNADEFDSFIHMCRAMRLDPIRRQAYAFVFKDKQGNRTLTVVTSIGGYRSIAERTGSYRPGPTRCVIQDSMKDPACNPVGIEYAEATVYKYSHGDWHAVTETAYWSEFAPVKEIWVNDQPSGKFQLDKKKDNWRKMPRVMLEKCAEAKALRRGWPDDFSGLYEETEIDHQMVDITPTEAAEEAATQAKLELIGGKDAVIVDWCDGSPLQRIGIGKFWDASLAWMRAKDRTSTEVRVWCHRNHASRAEAKAKAGSHYLDWWREVEKVTNELERNETTQIAS